jgi:hypothetical protein
VLGLLILSLTLALHLFCSKFALLFTEFLSFCLSSFRPCLAKALAQKLSLNHFHLPDLVGRRACALGVACRVIVQHKQTVDAAARSDHSLGNSAVTPLLFPTWTETMSLPGLAALRSAIICLVFPVCCGAILSHATVGYLPRLLDPPSPPPLIAASIQLQLQQPATSSSSWCLPLLPPNRPSRSRKALSAFARWLWRRRK